MDPVVDIVYGVGVLLTVLKSVRINSGWSKIYMWTQRSTFYDARELSYTLKWPWTMLLTLLLVLVYIWQFWNLFQSTQHGQKHISGHQDQPSMMSGSWVTLWSGPGPHCWHCCWCWCPSESSETCWCTSDSSETCSNQLSMVKNIYLDTKINLLQCQGAELHHEVAPDHVVGILNFSRFSGYVPGSQKWFNW